MVDGFGEGFDDRAQDGLKGPDDMGLQKVHLDGTGLEAWVGGVVLSSTENDAKEKKTSLRGWSLSPAGEFPLLLVRLRSSRFFPVKRSSSSTSP